MEHPALPPPAQAQAQAQAQDAQAQAQDEWAQLLPPPPPLGRELLLLEWDLELLDELTGTWMTLTLT